MFFLILMKILNIRKIFHFSFCFITLEKSTLFEFIKQYLDNLFFCNCLYFKTIWSDITKSLALVIAKQKTHHHANKNSQKCIF